MEYQWKTSFPKPKVSAQVFGEQLEQLEQVTPESVVEAARNRRSKLHTLFEWNAETAAEKYRHNQARHYIDGLQVVRVHVESGEPAEPRRAYLSVQEEPGTKRTYQMRDVVLSQQRLREQVLRQMERDLRAYLKRYAEVLEQSPALPLLTDAVDAINDEIERLSHEARRRPDRAKSGREEHAPEVGVPT